MVSNIVDEKLAKWQDNLPDYYDARNAMFKMGELEAEIIRVKREISRADNLTLAASGNPRSNETRIARNNATSALEDTLATLEAEQAKLKWIIEFIKLTKDIGYIINGMRFVNKPIGRE